MGGYFSDIERGVQTVMSIPSIRNLLRKNDPIEPAHLKPLIMAVMFDLKPREKLTLVDAAHILSFSRSIETDATLWRGETDPAEQLVIQAAHTFVNDITKEVLRLRLQFGADNELALTESMTSLFGVSPCDDTDKGQQELLFLLQSWISLAKQSGLAVVTLGNARLPAHSGMGYADIKVKDLANFDSYLRKKAPGLIGSSMDDVSALIATIKRDQEHLWLTS